MGVGNHVNTNSSKFEGLGRHLVADFYGCPQDKLSNNSYLIKILKEAAKAARVEVVGEYSKKFDGPGGVSAILIIKESHLSIHTWPEHGYAAIDIYTCGKSIDPWIALELIKEELQPETATIMEVKRGLMINQKAYLKEQIPQ
ncbi:MAG: adenosylmethionine decarboxylase [Halobacteria archaeon]